MSGLECECGQDLHQMLCARICKCDFALKCDEVVRCLRVMVYLEREVGHNDGLMRWTLECGQV
jgi:hypothetical protein